MMMNDNYKSTFKPKALKSFLLVACIFLVGFLQNASMVQDHQSRHLEEGNKKDSPLESRNIPKIVHQTYMTEDLPKNYDIWRKECMKINPGWEFKLWTDEDNENLIKNDYPHLYDLYKSYDVNIKRVDFARYVFLHQQGGVYMDLDFACLRPLDTVLEDIHDKFVVAGQYAVADWSGQIFANAFMATPPKHKVLDLIIAETPKFKNRAVVAATGPNFLTGVLKDIPREEDTWTYLPFDVIYGYGCQTDKADMCNSHESCKKVHPNGVTMTMWSHSWFDEGADFKDWETFLLSENEQETSGVEVKKDATMQLA